MEFGQTKHALTTGDNGVENESFFHLINIYIICDG